MCILSFSINYFNYYSFLRVGEEIAIYKKQTTHYFKMHVDFGNSNAMCKYANMLLDGE